MRDSRNPLDVTHQAQRKLEYFTNKRCGRPVSGVIIFALCVQLGAHVGADREIHATTDTTPLDVDISHDVDGEPSFFTPMMVSDGMDIDSKDGGSGASRGFLPGV